MLRHVRICCIQKIASHHGYSNSNIIRTSRNYSICMYWWSSQTCITYHHPAPPHLTYCWATFTLKKVDKKCTTNSSNTAATACSTIILLLLLLMLCHIIVWLVSMNRQNQCVQEFDLSILVGVSYWLVGGEIEPTEHVHDMRSEEHTSELQSRE